MKNKVLMIMVCMLLLVSGVSAFETLSFDEKIGDYGKITIDQRKWFDPFGWVVEKNVAEYELTSNTDNCIINCEASGTATLYEDEILFSSVKFLDKESKSKQIPYQFYIFNTTTQQWVDYDFKVLPSGEYQWKIKAQKDAHDSIDWIATAIGKELTEWAWWDTMNSKWSFEAFTSSGTFTVPTGVTNVSVVVVAGGGAGGGVSSETYEAAGGGGAGGLILDNSYAVTPGAGITVTVGTGGTGDYNSGNSGSNSVFGTITTTGGGGGGKDGVSGTSGGSGGGAGAVASGGTGTAGQGYDGGDSSNGDVSGGGGGASEVGADGVSATESGDGGDGLQIWSLDYLAGGGGGGARGGTPYPGAGDAGLGGGGDGGFIGAGSSATVNTGGGGGGASTGSGDSSYNGGSGGSGLVVVRWIHLPEVTLNNPADSTNSDSNHIYFNCTASDDIQLLNVSFMLDSAVNETDTSGTNKMYTFDKILADGTYDWTCRAANNISQFYTPGTRQITIGTIPSVIINSPLVTQSALNSVFFNATVSSYRALDNVSILIDGLYNETNVSGNNPSEYTKNITFVDGTYIWSYEACEDDGDCNMTTNRTLIVDSAFNIVTLTYPTTYVDYQVNNTALTFNWTYVEANPDKCWYDYNGTNYTVTCSDLHSTITPIDKVNKNLTLWMNDTVGNSNSSFASWDYKAYQNSLVYNSTTYETQTENYVLNISSDGLQTVTASLMYNGTEYTSTKTGDDEEMIFTNTITHGTNGQGYKNFYWKINYGAEEVHSTTNHQWLNSTTFNICNASLTIPYINFSFIDEETLLNINATIDTSTWTYYLGSGTETKSLSFSNTTANDNYAFCLDPETEILHNTRELQYASTGYPQRKYSASSDLTNATTNTTLYLLASGDGIYSNINVIDQTITNVVGASVTAERQFSGVWTVVEQETTDDSGSVTMWLNPNYDHRFTFTADDCTGTTTTIRPTQSLYTQQLSCATEDGEYTSQYKGINYVLSPRPGTFLLEDTVETFTFNITANLSNLIYYSMNITDKDGNQLNSTFGTTNIGGDLVVTVDTTGYDKLYGRYYINVGNGTYLIDPALWSVRTIEAGKGSIATFFANLAGSDPDIEDNYNTLILIFLIIFVGMAAFTYSTGMELAQPGISLFIIFFFVTILSIAGFFTIDFAPSDFMNKYGVLLVVFFLTGGYTLGQWGKT